MAKVSNEHEPFLQKQQNKEIVLSSAIGNIAEILTPFATTISYEDNTKALWQACQKVANGKGITLSRVDEKILVNHPDPIELIIRKSRIRRRRIQLVENWHLGDHGPILGFLKENKQPVALLPTADYHYNVFDPYTGSTYRLIDLDSLDSEGWVFYRTFGDQFLYFKDLVTFSQINNTKDWSRIVLMILAMGVISLSLPYGFGQLIQLVLSGMAHGQLMFLIILLLGGAIANTCCSLARGLAVLRIQGNTDNTLQSALIDRLLKLPLPFYREYQVGDLGMRAMGINQISMAFTGVNLVNILSAVLGVFYLIFIAIYSLPIALMTFGLLIILFGVTFLSGWKMLRYTRNEARAQGYVTGKVLQYINGIAKIRASAAEPLAFANWARDFANQQQNIYKSQLILCKVEGFNQAFPVVANLILFAVFTLLFKNLTLGTSGIFLAINASFGILIGLTLNLSQTLLQMLNVVPIYERLNPILKTLPEIDNKKLDPGKLHGDLEVQNLSFRYATGGPWVLRGITLEVKSGEYVAIVGSSGGGKSTFLRLLLGFEQASNGTIFYDHKDMTGLDIISLRQQIGAVLQTSQLANDSIYNNIIGASLYSLDDAWEALRLVGLDKDVEALPMGIHTFLSENGGMFSGGEKQRILIARALIGKPQILFLDEATSALDNQSQHMVTNTLQSLKNVTRIVLAHRLSTIKQVDRIFVFNSGQLVESGTYSELINKGGAFSELAKRQLA